MSKFYLAGFADERKQLRRIRLPGDTSHPVSINDATVIKDFYSIEVGGGDKSDFFERAFSDLEGPAAEVVRQLAADDQWRLQPAQKAALAAWIALQHLRTQAVRTGQAQMRSELIRIVVGASGKQALRHHIEAAEGKAIDGGRLDAEWADLTQEGGPRLRPSVIEHIRSIVELLPPTTAMLTDQQWSVSHYTQDVLVTCDHPVVLLPRSDQEPWEGIGLATAGGFAIPLTRHTGLVIGASPDLRDLVVPGSEELARSLNGHIAMNARESVYCHPDDADALAGFKLPAPQEREIGPTGSDDLISEDGLFAGFENNEVPRPLRADPSESEGFSLPDLRWPIPGRDFQYPVG